MKQVLALLILCGAAFGQSIIAPASTVNGVPATNLVTICNTNPGSGTCSSLVTTYTTFSVTTACSGTNGPLSGTGCSNPGYSDSAGNIVAFALSGQYWCQYKSSPTAIASSVPCSATGSGSGASNVPSTFGAAGATYCDQALTQYTAFQGRTVSGENNGTGVIQDCNAVDLQQTSGVNTLLVGGGNTGSIRTCVGWHVGDRDQIVGDNLGKGGTSVTTNSGANWLETSTFPTCQSGGTGITMAAASSGAGSVSFTLASGTANVIIGPGDQFVVTNGTADSQTYTIKNCTVTCAAGSGNWYQLNQGGSAVSINITPNLAQTQAGSTIIELIHPVWRLGEPVATSPQDALLKYAFVNGDSANGSTGIGVGVFDGAECQENCRAEDVYVRDMSVGIRIYGSHRSGTWRNLNVAYTNGSVGCPTPGAGSPGTIPMELAPLNTTVDGFTLFITPSGPCTPVQISKGGIHITNNPIGTIGNGVLQLVNCHVEMNGTGAPNTGDAVLIDSTTGSIEIHNCTWCPPASACLNGVHVASTFVGTLNLRNILCNVTGGTTNYIKDDVNGNTLPCSGATLTGTDFYSIGIDGTAWTDVGCGNMTKGWCLDTNGWRHFTAGVVDAQLAPTTKASAFQSVGTAATLAGTGACATRSGQLGGASIGQVTCTGTTGASTLTITPGLTATNGWSCWASDVTHTLAGSQSTASATAPVITFTTVTTSDVITFGCGEY